MVRGKFLMALVAVVLAAGPALAQQEKKAGGPLGLPACADLKTKLNLDEEQTKKCEEIYAGYKDKAAEAQKKVKDADEANKKAAVTAVKDLRTEIVNKLKEDLKLNDDQKKQLDELAAPKKKKAQN